MSNSLDKYKEHHDQETTQILPEQTPHNLIKQAMYWLSYYIEQGTDLAPINAVQDVLARLMSLFPEKGLSVESDETAILNREFEISVLTRLDLLMAGFSKEIVLSLTDEEMGQIAKRMGEAHNDNGYWVDLTDAITKLMEEKAKETKSSN